MYIKKVSIILPTYKPQEYLWECLDSISKQTLDKKLFELIIVLNGCSEPYKSNILRYINYALKDIDVIFVNIFKAGVSNARNVALEKAKGEYICFIDDDDYISPTYLEELLLNSSEDTLCLSNGISFIDKKGIIDSVYSKIYSTFSNKSVNINNVRQYLSCPVMKIIHRNIIGEICFDVRFSNGEDTLFMFLISDKIQNIVFTSKNAVYYRRIRVNSATTQKRTWYSKLRNVLKLNATITNAYLKKIDKYDFIFYLTRVLGLFKTLLK